MTGSASGGAKTAHIRLESGGKGGRVTEEEIINATPYDENATIREILLSGLWGIKVRAGGEGERRCDEEINNGLGAYQGRN